MKRPATRLAGVAMLALLGSAWLVACSGTDADPSPGGSAGDAAAGAPEPTQAGSAGAPVASAGAGGVAIEGGAPAAAGDTSSGGAGGSAEGPPDTPYAHEVVSFTEGKSAGFNADKFPDVVLDAPQGLGTGQGSLDVLSIGVGGEIVLGFGNREIVDGEGADFVVFENPFWPSDDPTAVFAELGEVSVSEDGETWHTFECDTEGDGEGRFPGCAGWTPTLEYDAESLVPLDPELTGGDAFDLADLGIEHARFVRIRDLKTQPAGGTTGGFDLDAVGIVHAN